MQHSLKMDYDDVLFAARSNLGPVSPPQNTQERNATVAPCCASCWVRELSRSRHLATRPRRCRPFQKTSCLRE